MKNDYVNQIAGYSCCRSLFLIFCWLCLLQITPGMVNRHGHVSTPEEAHQQNISNIITHNKTLAEDNNNSNDNISISNAIFLEVRNFSEEMEIGIDRPHRDIDFSQVDGRNITNRLNTTAAVTELKAINLSIETDFAGGGVSKIISDFNDPNISSVDEYTVSKTLDLITVSSSRIEHKTSEILRDSFSGQTTAAAISEKNSQEIITEKGIEEVVKDGSPVGSPSLENFDPDRGQRSQTTVQVETTGEKKEQSDFTNHHRHRHRHDSVNANDNPFQTKHGSEHGPEMNVARKFKEAHSELCREVSSDVLWKRLEMTSGSQSWRHRIAGSSAEVARHRRSVRGQVNEKSMKSVHKENSFNYDNNNNQTTYPGNDNADEDDDDEDDDDDDKQGTDNANNLSTYNYTTSLSSYFSSYTGRNANTNNKNSRLMASQRPTLATRSHSNYKHKRNRKSEEGRSPRSSKRHERRGKRRRSHRRHRSDVRGLSNFLEKYYSSDVGATSHVMTSHHPEGLPDELNLASWQCHLETHWKRMPEGVFPPFIETGRCTQKTCMMGLHSCVARRYVIRVLQKIDRSCNPVPLIGRNSTFEDTWNFMDYSVVSGCDCAQRRRSRKFVIF